MGNGLWWFRQCVLVVAGIFFLFFGIYVLIAAYGLKDPFSFVMTFFASNLIILISCALLAGFVFQMFRVLKGVAEVEEPEDGSTVENSIETGREPGPDDSERR